MPDVQIQPLPGFMSRHPNRFEFEVAAAHLRNLAEAAVFLMEREACHAAVRSLVEEIFQKADMLSDALDSVNAKGSDLK